MTDEFTFKNAQICICICGKNFFVDICKETAELCQDILNEAKARLRRLKSDVQDEDVTEEEICRFLKCSVDRILGDGATDSVFGERPQRISDVADLMCYVASKLKDGFCELAKEC